MAIAQVIKSKLPKKEVPGTFSKTAASVPLVADLSPEIRTRAEEIYRHRNGGPGNQQTDWVQAEKEINQKHNIFAHS